MVNSFADTNTGTGNSGTLRYVINQANANNTGTASSPDAIQFNTGAGTISVSSALPALTDIAVIDATTASGYVGTPIITLDGTNAGPNANGLMLSGGSSTIKGFNIGDFSDDGIVLDTHGSNTVMANNITDNSQVGVLVNGVTSNGILATTISGNDSGGIVLENHGNNNQPAPVLTQAFSPSGGSVKITGSLTATANTTYTIQFFSSPAGTAPGEGQTYQGSTTITTNGNGTSTIAFLTEGTGVHTGTTYTATATDPSNNTSVFSAPIPISAGIFAVGADAGTTPQVNVYNSAGQFLYSFLAYDSSFTGGVRVAVGIFPFGGGAAEIVTAPGPGGGPNIRVFNGSNGTLLGSFMAFNPAFGGGVTVAAGDISGSGSDDIICGAGFGGGPNVSIFSIPSVIPVATFSLVQSFFAFNPAFGGGVTVAAGDLNVQGFDDIIVGAGPGGGPQVSVFNGVTGAMLNSFFAFNPAFDGGVYVASGDVNGDGHSDIIVGAGAGAGANVIVFSGADYSVLQNFFAFNPTFAGGVRVGANFPGTTGRAAILTGAGPGGGPQVTQYDGQTLAVLDTFFAFSPTFTGGVYVAGT
jgi:hypothetical protein